MITVEGVSDFFRSYELECDEKLISEWMEKSPVGRDLVERGHEIDEWHMYNFQDWWSIKGTAYEEGIDDQTKIIRLLDEIAYLKQKNLELQFENSTLLDKLDYLPF